MTVFEMDNSAGRGFSNKVLVSSPCRIKNAAGGFFSLRSRPQPSSRSFGFGPSQPGSSSGVDSRGGCRGESYFRRGHCAGRDAHKQGPYVSGWYGWKRSANPVPNPPVKTDRKGEARIPASVASAGAHLLGRADQRGVEQPQHDPERRRLRRHRHERGDRRRRALVDVRRPLVERRHRRLEREPGDDQRERGQEQRVVAARRRRRAGDRRRSRSSPSRRRAAPARRAAPPSRASR